MKVAVNGRFINRPITGVERYAHEISGLLDARVIRPKHSSSGIRGHLWEQVSLPRQVLESEILWSPANTGPLFRENQVVSIHDLSPIDHPGWFTQAFAGWYRFLVPKVARRSRKVLTVSEFSRSRLIERLGLSPEKVVAIPQGINRDKFCQKNENEIQKVRTKYNLPRRYLLFVGSVQPRKNIRTLLRAWNQVGGAYPDVGLVVVGGSGEVFRRTGLGEVGANVVLPGYVEDTDLPALISGADAFVHPSHYEGSGMALLEAMACGCPVAASDIPAFRETAQDSALYFSPENTAELSEVLETLLEQENVRVNLKTKGSARVRLFSWEKTAARVWAALQAAE